LCRSTGTTIATCHPWLNGKEQRRDEGWLLEMLSEAVRNTQSELKRRPKAKKDAD
jgi:hypothetical protein